MEQLLRAEEELQHLKIEDSATVHLSPEEARSTMLSKVLWTTVFQKQGLGAIVQFDKICSHFPVDLGILTTMSMILLCVSIFVFGAVNDHYCQ